MQKQSNNNRSGCRFIQYRRRGTAAVEFAIVALPLFMFLFAGVEFGRAMMAMQSLEEAARAGCRRAVLDDANDQEVQTAIGDALAGSGISDFSVEVNPQSLEDAQRWEPITVRVTTTYEQISWLPTPIYFKGMTYTASCTFPREAQSDE